MAEGVADAVMTKAEEYEQSYRDLLALRTANRRSLRDLDAQGFLSAKQQTRLDEIYPPRGATAEAA